MKQSDVKLGAMYRVIQHSRPSWTGFSLCKVRHHSHLWVEVTSEHLENMYAYRDLGILKRYHPNQVVITIEEGRGESRFKVLVDGEILTMDRMSWHSMVEVEQ